MSTHAPLPAEGLIFLAEDYLASQSWPFVEARRVLAHVQAKGKRVSAENPVLFATGYGPSGLPHIGTFGEVFRTSMVQEAFRRLAPTLPTKLVCVSDDLDGLRKVPDNVPNPAVLKQHLGQPLSRVPDPFGEHASFGAHNNAMLCRFLDGFGFDYEFISSSKRYESGANNAALLNVLRHHQAVVDVIVPTLGEERAASYSPFLPIDPDTGVVLQVPVVATDVAEGTITYVHPDGRHVTTKVTDGACKLQWKPDWAMRWVAMDVDYEMCGKDLIDSVTLGSQIARILGGAPPVNLVYEHFVDEQGAKISKSKGNGLTIEEWLRYAPAPTLALFMFRTPTRAKKLYRGLIGQTVEEYADLLTAYPTQDAKARLENPVFHIHHGQVPPNPLPFAYSMLLNLVSVTAATEPGVVWQYLSRHRPDLTAATHPELTQLIEGAIRLFSDTVKALQAYRAPTDDTERTALTRVDALLASFGANDDAEAMQTQFYELGKELYGKERLRDWFKFLYESLLGFANGPRLGTFVTIFGVGETRALVAKALAR